jgi:curved DNA-binding protein CbpA
VAAPADDYYTILGVPESATAAEIRSAYRRAARTTHPDVNPADASAVERFKAIQRAYDVLSDPLQRAAYRRPSLFRPVAPSVRSGARRPAPGPATDLRTSVPPDLWDTIEAARVVARRRLGRRFRQLIRYLEGL